jgi:hypothetical protein
MFVGQFRGAQTVFRNLRAKSARDSANAERGLAAGGKFIIRESLKVVPVEHGVLKSTWFVRMLGKGFKARVFMGYTAAYALWVHENLDAAHGSAFNAKHAAAIKLGLKRKRGPNQQAKFLERPAREKRGEALAIIRGHMATP